MKDPATGRLYRADGQAELFYLAERPVPGTVRLRAKWIEAKTGYPVDHRTVWLTEATRQEWFIGERESNGGKPKGRSSRSKFGIPDRFQFVQELRTSERKVFGTCPKQWYWSYIEELAPARTPNPLWFGAAVHDALAKWYQPGKHRGPHPAETFLEVAEGDRRMRVETEEDEQDYVNGRDLGVNMLEAYVDEYGTDEKWQVLAVEQTFALLFKRSNRVWMRYLLTIDGLVLDQDTGEIWILENKTAKQIRTDHLHLDNQAGSYYAAAPYVLPLNDLLKPGQKISGIRYNFLRKAMQDDRPRNADGHYTNKPTKINYQQALEPLGVVVGKSMTLDQMEQIARDRGIIVLGDVSKNQPPPYFLRTDVFRTPEEQKTQLRRIEDEAQYMREMRFGNPAFPVMKTPGDHCNWCPFRRMCELDEQGDVDAVESFKAAMMIKRDPYAAYHKSA